jgi:uncharacterized protein
MDQRISVLTIGAENMDAMKAFYNEVLGWKPTAENKDIVFYKLNGFLLSICDRKLLTEFIGISSQGRDVRPITIGYNVDTKEEVITLYEQLKANVKILKEPTEPPFGGLFFYFTDIEGNILEVAYNPFITLNKDKNVVDHKPIDHL